MVQELLDLVCEIDTEILPLLRLTKAIFIGCFDPNKDVRDAGFGAHLQQFSIPCCIDRNLRYKSNFPSLLASVPVMQDCQ